MQIRNATSADLSAVETLLSASDLPLDGVKDNFASFVVAEDEGEVAGALASNNLARSLCCALPWSQLSIAAAASVAVLSSSC
jgi:N-acetylglutamate synthase-like GNAT family acetyltransferase